MGIPQPNPVNFFIWNFDPLSAYRLHLYLFCLSDWLADIQQPGGADRRILSPDLLLMIGLKLTFNVFQAAARPPDRTSSNVTAQMLGKICLSLIHHHWHWHCTVVWCELYLLRGHFLDDNTNILD